MDYICKELQLVAKSDLTVAERPNSGYRICDGVFPKEDVASKL